MADLQFLDAREALFALLDGTVHAGATITAYQWLTVDFADQVTTTAAAVAATSLGGPSTAIDQTERVVVDVYAEGEAANKVAKSIKSALADQAHDVPGVGYIDTVKVEVLPHDVPYQHDRLNQSQMVLRVTSRPL